MTDTAAAYGMDGWPVGAVIAGLFVVVMGRSHLFYWLGRGAFRGAARLADRAHPDAEAGDGAVADGAAGAPGTGLRGRAERLLTTPTARRGVALVHRWGPLAVTGAYLTVGVQTAVFVGAGLVRMPYLRFAVASVPGAVAWAVIWGTVGLSAVWAGLRLATASPWALAVTLAALAALAGWVVARRRARRAAAPGPGAPAARSDELV